MKTVVKRFQFKDEHTLIFTLLRLSLRETKAPVSTCSFYATSHFHLTTIHLSISSIRHPHHHHHHHGEISNFISSWSVSAVVIQFSISCLKSSLLFSQIGKFQIINNQHIDTFASEIVFLLFDKIVGAVCSSRARQSLRVAC